MSKPIELLIGLGLLAAAALAGCTMVTPAHNLYTDGKVVAEAWGTGTLAVWPHSQPRQNDTGDLGSSTSKTAGGNRRVSFGGFETTDNATGLSKIVQAIVPLLNPVPAVNGRIDNAP